MVVVDRLTKLAHFMLTNTIVMVIGAADLFFAYIFRYHGLPKEIVLDKDPRFVSSYWKALSKLCSTELSMSMAYHPQTDGQQKG